MRKPNEVQVLIVDDEWNMRNLLRIYLNIEGFIVTEAQDGYEALQMMDQRSFDLVVLDIMMPDMDGWEVCKKIRETKTIPILMLTARTETKDKVQGLTLGADDYLVKPFDHDELIARIHALLRRAESSFTAEKPQQKISYPGFTVYPESRQISICEKIVPDITPKEFDLLYVLASKPGRVYSRDQLLEQLWGLDYNGDQRAVDTHVKNIREKLRKAGLPGNPIQTVWGIGYKFEGMESNR